MKRILDCGLRIGRIASHINLTPDVNTYLFFFLGCFIFLGDIFFFTGFSSPAAKGRLNKTIDKMAGKMDFFIQIKV